MQQPMHLAQYLRTPAPCDACPHAARCAAELLACSAFVRFVSHGSGWQGLARINPTPGRFTAVYASEDDSGDLAARKRAAGAKGGRAHTRTAAPAAA